MIFKKICYIFKKNIKINKAPLQLFVKAHMKLKKLKKHKYKIYIYFVLSLLYIEDTLTAAGPF